jgi:NTE family protein
MLRMLLLILLLTAGPASAAATDERPSIGLALGSGGAGGLAHIAMLEVFEALSIRPDAISGSSIGAIVGALYAAGLDSQEIRALFIEFGESAMNPFAGLMDDEDGVGWTDLVDLDFENAGLISADGFLELVGKHIEARDFADLEIPLQIVATDYWSGEAVVLTEGDLMRAIRASMAVPGLFAPVKDGDRLLVDGGIANPLPWDLLEGQELIVAIDVTGIRAPSPDGPPGFTMLLFKSFEIMQQSLIRQKLATAPPGIYIKPRLDDVRLLHFDRVDEVIAKAGRAADELRGQLESAISK